MPDTAIPAADTGLPNTTQAFIARLMEPLPEAELADPKLKRLEQQARREARNAHHELWHGGQCRVEMMEARYRALDWQRLAHLHGSYPEPPSDDALHAAHNAWGEEIDRQMEIPAPTMYHLKWKRHHEPVAVDRYRIGLPPAEAFMKALSVYIHGDKELEERKRLRAEAIARDEAALGGKRSGGRSH